MADAEVEEMRKRMTQAAQLDAINRREGKPAIHKLKMLPEVVSLLNRNQYVSSLVDPEINLLEAVKFFLEPLDDGSLPAYNIQRDLMEALAKLPINKEALIASGIGKVIVFYTKSKRPEEKIKRMAERLLAEWTRPILQRSDDYSKKVYEEVDFDPTYVSLSPPLLFIQMFCFLGADEDSTPDNWSTAHKCCLPRPLPRRLVPKSSFPLVWPTVLGARQVIPHTRLCRARRPFRRASSPVLWEPVERTVSAR